MQNYWLSEFEEKTRQPDMEDSPDPQDDMPEDDEDSEEPEGNDVKGNLNKRQQALYDYYEKTVEEFGMFRLDSKANGAHYAPAEENPFKEKGLICANCVFFIGGGGCEIVAGRIEPEAICKLWIIPEELINE
jgi:hypothetical protein